jgi:acyl-CoA synthetase (AMP-forming)/AMP-acid ligase II
LTLGALVEAAATRWADDIAIEDGDVRLSFAALKARAAAFSRALIAEGLEAGDRVAIWAPNSAEWELAAIGAQQIGLIVVPLNTRFKGREAADILGRSGTKLLFSVSGFLGLDLPTLLAGEDLPALQRTVLLNRGGGDLAAFLAMGEKISDAALAARIAAVSPEDVIDILYTSGTTGRPKGVMSAHRQNILTFEAWANSVGLHAGDRYLVVNPYFHSFGYKAGWLACLLRGATALPVAMFDAGRILAMIEEQRITVLPGPPTIYQSLLDDPAHKTRNLSSLRLAVTGAASVPPSLIRRMHDELGIRDVLTAYGLTETCGVVTATKAGDPAELVASSCGLPIPGVSIRLVDPDGKEVADGEPGELLVRGFNVMKGYFDDPDATAETIDAEGWLRTGDIAIRDAEGYLRITDRAKDMFISGGFNCYPAEIEALILDHPGVARVAVTGVPDARMGEVCRAWIVPKPGETIEEAAFIAWCRGHMANYKAPRSIRVVETLPMNAAGKVQRFLLKDDEAVAA